jgi:hypothetical protein
METPNLEMVLHGFAGLVAAICFLDSYINVKRVVKLIKYSGATKDDEYMHYELMKAERAI